MLIQVRKIVRKVPCGQRTVNKKRGRPLSLPPFDALKASRLRSTLCPVEAFIHGLAQIASAIWIKH